jgi:hypothetical protein
MNETKNLVSAKTIFTAGYTEPNLMWIDTIRHLTTATVVICDKARRKCRKQKRKRT